MFMRLFFVVLNFVLLSCVASPPDTGYPSHSDPELKSQLAFAVDGKNYVGAGVVQRKSLSKISVTLPDKSYLVIVNTCARQDEFWYPDLKKQFVYEYTPAMDSENFGSCPMYITAITERGEWYRAILDWTNSSGPEAKVDIMCNGRWLMNVQGTYFCEVYAGLPVRIKSQTPAVISKDPESDCPELKTLWDLREWEIVTKKGESALCVYVLLNKNKEEFRFTTHAYTSILRVFPPSK